MDVTLTLILLAAAVLAIGLARLITQATAVRLLDVAGTVLAGAVLIVEAFNLR